MTRGAAQKIAEPRRALLPRLRGRIIVTFTAIVLAACTAAAALMLVGAWRQRQAIENRAVATATTLSFGFDQEVAAVNYLLKGLSKSPALLSGDIRVFYDQLKATPVPEGSWLILYDLEKQLANTLRPFGSALPRISDFANFQEQIDWGIGGPMPCPVLPAECAHNPVVTGECEPGRRESRPALKR